MWALARRGDLRAANVIDVGYRREEIVAGIRRALATRISRESFGAS